MGLIHGDRQESPGKSAPQGAVGVSMLEVEHGGNESSWKHDKDKK